MGIIQQAEIEYAQDMKAKAEAELRDVLGISKLVSEPNPTSGGGRTNYYLVRITYPQREEQPAYTAECEDIIEALELNFDEANIFKEIWRTANARKGNAKQGQNDIRAAEKIYHYAGRILKRAIRSIESK